MKQRCGNFPELETVNIDDDATAQTIMLELGVWDQMTKEASLTSELTMVLADNHPTHWCLCARHRNNPDPKENGFQVVAYPKKLMDHFTAQMILQEHLSGSTEVSVDMFEPKPLD